MVKPILILQARAEARALLYGAGEYADLDEALRPLLDFALESGIADEIGVDAMFAIVSKAFEPEPHDYDAADDFTKSIELCYDEIRARKAAGGKGWEPPQPWASLAASPKVS